ncbi:histidinol dehydrogenase [Streptomyces sp. NPDC093252]|uniref:histidinol dehydrogenase n=1 Tax=Streptomyces sp. NPDC093252 TaxID=3154980 RepID=UPI00343ACFDB
MFGEAGTGPFAVAVTICSAGPSTIRDSPAVPVAASCEVATAAVAYTGEPAPRIPARDSAGATWRDHGQVHEAHTPDAAHAPADTPASEHAQILTARPRRALTATHHHGAPFPGGATCVSHGDKAIGTNRAAPRPGGRPLHRGVCGSASTSRR